MIYNEYPCYREVRGAYGEVEATPLFIANKLCTSLEKWFQDCKFHHLAISSLSEETYNVPLQLEFNYTNRVSPQRSFLKTKEDAVIETDLLNYHKLIKIVHEYTELFYKNYLVLNEHKQGDFITSFEEHIKRLCKKFHSNKFPNKLKLIENKLGLESALDSLVQMNKIRNCLEHRQGIVGEKDCDSRKDYMSVTWRYPKPCSIKGEYSPLSNIKGFSSIEVNFVDEVRKFRKGGRVELDFDDNHKCVYTVLDCFKVIIDALYEQLKVNQEETPMIIRNFSRLKE